MPSGTKQAEPRLTRWEILGAWLHVWTPARGAEVPPVPWRTLTLWAVPIAIVLAVAAAIAIPQIDSGKKQGAAERARQEAAATAAEVARLRTDQRVHTLVVPTGVSLLNALEDAITQDAKARVAAKTITGPVFGTNCVPAAVGITQFPDSRVFKCFVATSGDLPGESKDIIGTGYPFVATIYAKKRQLSWCKENPHADEKGSRGDVRTRISPVCAGKLSQILG